MLRSELGDLQQTPILLASAAHREADAAKAEQHHRPGRRFRNAPGTCCPTAELATRAPDRLVEIDESLA